MFRIMIAGLCFLGVTAAFGQAAKPVQLTTPVKIVNKTGDKSPGASLQYINVNGTTLHTQGSYTVLDLTSNEAIKISADGLPKTRQCEIDLSSGVDEIHIKGQYNYGDYFIYLESYDHGTVKNQFFCWKNLGKEEATQ